MQESCGEKFLNSRSVFERRGQTPSPQCTGRPARGFAPAKRMMAGCLPHRHGNENKQKVERLVDAIISKGIKLLALDFDLTFIGIHTHGEWHSSVEELTTHVRPCMRDLLQHAQQKGLFVAIVTFHPLRWLIRELINKLYPKKIAKHIYLQAMSHTQARRGSDGYVGKVVHIQKVVEEIGRVEGVTINKREILLLDDDMSNVQAAINFGHRSMQVQVQDKEINYSTLDSFERMLRIAG